MSRNLKEEQNILSYFVKNRKWILWALLIVGGFFFLNNRYNLVNGSFTSVDMIILLFWIALLLMPFFQEIDFYGLKLKKEIDELKLDINKQFIDLSRQFISLKSEIKNSNEYHPQLTYNVTNSLSDDQLLKREEFYRQILEETLDSRGIKRSFSESELTKAPDDVQYLFSIRYQVETELKRILKETSYEWNPKRMITIEMVRVLTSKGLIDPDLVNIILQVHKITSMAIHGEDISEDKLHFVQNIAPDLIATLKGITGNNIFPNKVS